MEILAMLLAILLAILIFVLVIGCVVAFVFFKRLRFKLLCFGVWFFMLFSYVLWEVIRINSVNFDDILDEMKYRQLAAKSTMDMIGAYLIISLVVLLISIAVKACINKYKEYRQKDQT